QLCRCGESRDKPHCDKSHIQHGFSSHKLAGRQPDQVDRYEGKEITILDNRGVCSHRGHCTTNLPGVFRQRVEPWIGPNGVDREEIARVIRMCPSGALSYEMKGVTDERRDRPVSVELLKNGPIEVSGPVRLVDEEGSTPQTDHYALCRCGGSRNKPFCDGSHWHNGFTDKKELQDQTKQVTERHMDHIQFMAAVGRSVIEPMGPLLPLPSWDDITVRGAQLSRLPVNEDEPVSLRTLVGPSAKRPLEMSLPVYVTHMSFGALSREAKVALAKGSAIARTAMCSGEGGIVEESRSAAHKYIFEYVQNEYSVSAENLRRCDAVEIKIGQAVKPGIGGHFPAAKMTEEIAAVRKKPRDRDIVTPARYPDITDAESLGKKVSWLRVLSGGAPVGVKIAAGNIEADLEVAVAARPDFVTIDGQGGATGSVMKFVKDAASVPTLFAVARAGRYFREKKIQGISLVVTGGLRVSSDFVKAIALGADAVAVGTAALMAIGCRQYRMCHTGLCPTGITSQDPVLRSRINVERAAGQLGRYFQVTRTELEVFTRMCGHSRIEEFTIGDLSTRDSTIAEVTGIQLG
ncbi:MAG: glutamate synthase-related protein, partial [Spirochaetia bacterium]